MYSHVHFSGTTRNDYRDQLGTPIQQKTNLEDLMVTYQITPRVSVQGVLPFLSASRRAQQQYATLHTSGLSDISVGAQSWVRSQRSDKAKKNNIQLGLGLLMPTGAAHQKNDVITTFGGARSIQFPDYSAQPGIGSWGAIMSWQAFQDMGNSTILFCDGQYVMTQGGYHEWYTSHGGTREGVPAASLGKTQFDAIQDQYMVEVGFSHPAPKIKGLGLILSLRDEGVPAHNLIGNDLGFRRPGFSVNITPGFIYTRGNHMLQFSVGKAIFRDRTRSVPEEIEGRPAGDAAFVNYVWQAGYTLRLPGKRNEEAKVIQPNGLQAAVANQLAKFKNFNLKTLDGQKKTLQDYANKVTLVSFFYPRCPYCNLELPEQQKMYDKYKDKGLSMVWINILPDEESLIKGWQLGKNLNVPVLVGASQDSLTKDYKLVSTPTTYLLGPGGEVIFLQTGYKPGDETTLENRIAIALAGGTP